MNSKEKILNAIKNNQPPSVTMPAEFQSLQNGSLTGFQNVLESIGGKVYTGKIDEVTGLIEALFSEAKRIVSVTRLIEKYYLHDKNISYPTLHDVDLVIIKAKLGVAENGAVWLTEEDMIIRVLPFIGENLFVVLDERDIVANMHGAYEIINNNDYGFGVFIAGPSKTADIEQSLVLGAHGPKTMTVFIINEE